MPLLQPALGAAFGDAQALLARRALGTAFGDVAILRQDVLLAVFHFAEQRLWVEVRQCEGVGGEQAQGQADGKLAFHDGLLQVGNDGYGSQY